MNCRQYINAVNRRASYSNKHVSHGTPSRHSAGRKCSYVPPNPPVVAGKWHCAGSGAVSSVGGQTKRRYIYPDGCQQKRINERKVSGVSCPRFQFPVLCVNGVYNPLLVGNFYPFIVSTRF